MPKDSRESLAEELTAKGYKKLAQALRETYHGPALEQGGTSRGGGVAPPVKWLFGKDTKDYGLKLPKAAKILDYGAGKYGRNAEWLRSQGYRVYAYDPYNSNSSDGWGEGNISSRPPPVGEKFDVVFTAYVLNVVPQRVEKEIVAAAEQYGGRVFHVVRNRDIFSTFKKALAKGAGTIFEFFRDNFATAADLVATEAGELPDARVMDFAFFGAETPRGFQRIPQLEDYRNYKVIRRTGNFKVYGK
jgi:hypothetical protein